MVRRPNLSMRWTVDGPSSKIHPLVHLKMIISVQCPNPFIRWQSELRFWSVVHIHGQPSSSVEAWIRQQKCKRVLQNENLVFGSQLTSFKNHKMLDFVNFRWQNRNIKRKESSNISQKSKISSIVASKRRPKNIKNVKIVKMSKSKSPSKKYLINRKEFPVTSSRKRKMDFGNRKYLISVHS